LQLKWQAIIARFPSVSKNSVAVELGGKYVLIVHSEPRQLLVKKNLPRLGVF
jgi:hypothetical protein